MSFNTHAEFARNSCTSSAAKKLTSLLSNLFSHTTSAQATAFLASKQKCTPQQRRNLGTLAGLQEAWIKCDQNIQGNLEDLAKQIVTELYDPFWFYRRSLLNSNPSALFQAKKATPPLKLNKNSFWIAPNGTKTTRWLPQSSWSQVSETSESSSGSSKSSEGSSESSGSPATTTFHAVVHFVQGGSGTGVHIGHGKVLTCAHVVDARSDDELDDIIPARVGRQKVVMFPSGRTFLSECAAQVETLDGTKDVAVVVLGTEIDLHSLPLLVGNGDESKEGSSDYPPMALFGREPASVGERLFCVGNPSSIDLESIDEGTIEFEPPTWHTSIGCCEGYLDPSVHAAAETMSERGRAPTRGEKTKYIKAAAVKFDNVEEGLFLEHSCWTYWGHSGAPLFNEVGEVVGLHCAWDDRTGIRHAQKLQNLLDATAKCEASKGCTKRKGGATGISK